MRLAPSYYLCFSSKFTEWRFLRVERGAAQFGVGERRRRKKGFSRSTQHESPSARFSSFTCGKRTPDASLSLAVELIFLSNISTPAGLFSTLRNENHMDPDDDP